MSDYDQSQDLATRADTALAAGDIATARQLHRDAGEIQARLVAALPPDRVRTRSAFGLSAASLLYRGQALDEAERLVHQLLAGGVADDGCHGRLRALLCRIWNERRLSEIDVREESGASLSVTLQGGRVLYGRAPIGVVDMVTRLTTNYIRRMAAWRNGRAYRRRETGTGDDLIEGYRAHAFEPVASSYRVEFHLARHQLALDLGPAFSGQATPTDIIDGCMTLARLVRTSRQDEVREYIQDPKYRGALVRLVHALVPDGHDIGEVELRRPEEEKERAVRLSHAMRRPVGSLLRAIAPPPRSDVGTRAETLEGTLRAIDLDDGQLRLVWPGGERLIEIQDELHDVIGPMLNRDVRVEAHLPPPRTKIWIASDVQLLHRD